ncbi:MAG: LysR family transcriptional regulator, partial [Proteobacteria bacterium]|nr:LysR family transcriptional regulator [Pseudomonadota bacterium]
MREVNLAAVDLNLLPALDALLQRRNVSRAAADVGLSQPAMSRALARLRDVLGDPLLVRGAGGFALTPRALRLVPKVVVALEEIRGVYRDPQFDPRHAKAVLRVACSDFQTVLIAPALMARLAQEAPGVDVRMEAYSRDVARRIDSGALDLAFATSTTPLPPGAQSQVIGNHELALVMRRRHPAARRAWTIGDYAKFDHVAIALTGDGQSELDAGLARAGVRRRIALVTPHFMAAVATVAKTDLVTTIARSFASRFAADFDLVLKRPPLEAKTFEMTLVWSHVRSSDPLLAW